MAVKPPAKPPAGKPTSGKPQAGSSAGKPEDKDAADRREIIRVVRGPVLQRVLQLIPAFGAYPNPYQFIISNPEILHGCVQLIRKQREEFQDLMVDGNGQPVTDDMTPLRCHRNLDQIVAMVARSGCKAYAEVRWAPEPVVDAVQIQKPEAKTLLDKLRQLVTGKWTDAEAPKQSESQAELFYKAISDYIHYDWQIPLIPYFAELPVKLLTELASGCTQLRNPEAIMQLADIGRQNMDQARKILSSASLREMLDVQPLAAKGIAFLGKTNYDFLHGAVYDQMGEKFWEMCIDTDRLEAIETRNPKDIENMAPYLHLIGADTINTMLEVVSYSHVPVFLEVALEQLGEATFTEIFGPHGDKKLIKVFCQKTAAYKLDQNEPLVDLAKRLPDVFVAYKRAPADFARGF